MNVGTGGPEGLEGPEGPGPYFLPNGICPGWIFSLVNTFSFFIMPSSNVTRVEFNPV